MKAFLLVLAFLLAATSVSIALAVTDHPVLCFVLMALALSGVKVESRSE